MYDIDKNGKVDKKEMEQIILAIYDLLGEENRKGENSPAERVKKIMTKLGNYLSKFIADCSFDFIYF